MKRLGWVAWFEYRKNVFKKSFLWSLGVFPLIVTFIIGMVAIVSISENNTKPVGYIDRSGFLSDPVFLPALDEGKPIQFIAFSDEEAAREALKNQSIQAYFILPEGYPAEREVKLVYHNRLASHTRQQILDFLLINRLRGYPPQIQTRTLEGSDVFLRLLGKDMEVGGDAPTLSNLLPLLITIGFVFLVLLSSGYLMNAVTDEKENRMMEVLATTVSPSRLITGKILGIAGIGVTLLVSWIAFGMLAIWIGGSLLDMPFFQDFHIDWQGVLIVAAIGLPSYVMACGLMVVIGSTIAQPSEGQAAGSLFMLAYLLPIYVMVPLIENPQGLIGLIFSLLPFTSLISLGFRSVFMYVPPWQIVISLVLQVGYAVAAIWLAGRAFRLGMVRYGKAIRLREILRQQTQEGAKP